MVMRDDILKIISPGFRKNQKQSMHLYKILKKAAGISGCLWYYLSAQVLTRLSGNYQFSF